MSFLEGDSLLNEIERTLREEAVDSPPIEQINSNKKAK
jgi:hypothetical protein